MVRLNQSQRNRDRALFLPVAVLGGVFCITILMIITASIGDPEVPFKKWLNRYAGHILLTETVLLIVASLAAMTIDRIRTKRRLRNEAHKQNLASSAAVLPQPEERYVD